MRGWKCTSCGHVSLDPPEHWFHSECPLLWHGNVESWDGVELSEEDVLRVLREDCSQQGHDFNVIQAVGHEEPIVVACRHCGRMWPVQAGVPA